MLAPVKTVKFLAGAIVYYVTGISCCILLLHLAPKWPELALLWQKTELGQKHYGYPKNLRRNILTLASAIFIIVPGRLSIGTKHLCHKQFVFLAWTRVRTWGDFTRWYSNQSVKLTTQDLPDGYSEN